MAEMAAKDGFTVPAAGLSAPDFRAPATPPTPRVLSFWIPDWPVLAAVGPERAATEAVAVIDSGVVLACSESARSAGIRRGLRLREAQARMADLVVCRYNALATARAYDTVTTSIEAMIPGVHVVRPGLCAVPARGPARFYRGEENAALAVLAALAEHGLTTTRVGVADGLFTAEQAARAAGRGSAVVIVPPGGSAEFLAPFPVAILGDQALTTVLLRLGLTTLGAFARLGAEQVRHRFGPSGAVAHTRALGRDTAAATPHTAIPEYTVTREFEPPLDGIDQIAFAIRSPADEFIAGFTADLLVCTAITVTIADERGGQYRREWQHPRWFTAADVVDRVRWQLGGPGGAGGAGGSGGSGSPGGASPGGGLGAAIARITLEPAATDAMENHHAGLWGSVPDEGIHHALSRIQSILGHTEVVIPTVVGGRLLGDRQLELAWGDKASDQDLIAATRPWPGSLPAPTPARVFPVPPAAAVIDDSGELVTVTPRGLVSAAPAAFLVDTGAGADSPSHRVAGWAGPWPVDQRWWDDAAAILVYRFQLITESGEAWLLITSGTTWWAEAHYD